MIKISKVLCVLMLGAVVCSGQTTPEIPDQVPVKEMEANAPAAPNTYESNAHGFRVTFSGLWVIADEGFAADVSEHGIDLSLTSPESLDAVSKSQLDRYLDHVTILANAYRMVPGAKAGAVVRISAEDLRAVPQVRDAVDYFDLMRSQFAAMRLSADIKYSETQAEKLGKRQYAFLDISSSAGKKRLYATVRGRYAIAFTLSYTSDAELQSFREILSGAEFFTPAKP